MSNVNPIVWVLGYVVLAYGHAAAQSAPAKLLVGDAKVQELQSYSGVEPLPKPDRIRLDEFLVPLDVISIDNSAGSRLHARRLALEGKSPDTTPEAAARHVEASFSGTLEKELGKTSIPFVSDSAAAVNTLIVRGEFTKIDEGNRSKRVMIGFGRGATDVQAHVTVLLDTGSSEPVVLSEFKLNSASGKKPGAAATMGVGSAAAGVATGSVGDKKATVEADASRMAKAVAKQIQDLMIAQKWMDAPQSAAK